MNPHSQLTLVWIAVYPLLPDSFRCGAVRERALAPASKWRNQFYCSEAFRMQKMFDSRFTIRINARQQFNYVKQIVAVLAAYCVYSNEPSQPLPQRNHISILVLMLWVLYIFTQVLTAWAMSCFFSFVLGKWKRHSVDYCVTISFVLPSTNCKRNGKRSRQEQVKVSPTLIQIQQKNKRKTNSNYTSFPWGHCVCVSFHVQLFSPSISFTKRCQTCQSLEADARSVNEYECELYVFNGWWWPEITMKSL